MASGALDRHSKVSTCQYQKMAICKGHDKPRLMGVASHLFSRWFLIEFIHVNLYTCLIIITIYLF